MVSLPGSAHSDPVARLLTETVRQSPLVPVALLVTTGIVLDRFFPVPFSFSLLVAGCFLVAFVLGRFGAQQRLALLYLAGTCVALGCAHHHLHRHLRSADDIARFVGATPGNVLVRGWIAEGPRRTPQSPADPLRSQQLGESASIILRANSLRQVGGEQLVSGRVRVLVLQGQLRDLYPGDEVAVEGRLTPVSTPSNPAEFDVSRYWQDRGVGAVMVVRSGDLSVVRTQASWFRSVRGWLGWIRERGHQQLEYHLSPSIQRVARALLLGEGAPMTRDDWGKYIRTGVVHILAISGQHLVLVAGFLGFVLYRLGLRQRRAVLLVAILLLAYALLSGGRPPAMRAAVAACAISLAVVLGRMTTPANLLALGWLVVILLQPSDVFDQGCQLSFLAVAVLTGVQLWDVFGPEDALEAQIRRTDPLWQQGLRWVGREILKVYIVHFIVWLSIMPLVMMHTGIFPPAALLLGPILSLLASISLAAGFVLFLVCWSNWLTWPVSMVVGAGLTGCEWCVDGAERLGTHVYLAPLPVWWVIGLYLMVLSVLLREKFRRRWRWALAPMIGWLSVGLLAGAAPLRSGSEFRCTFLSVGHGGCVVLEMPDGRTMLYDVGSMRGPDLTTHVLTPYLWSRGITHLDDVILSHADIDHFNGLPALLERFHVGRILCSETFSDKASLAVNHTLEVIRRQRVPMEILRAGDRLECAGVRMDILHPTTGFHEATQNACSVVMTVRHAGAVILLTGDIEGVGLERILLSPIERVDVLQAPHHGSARLDIPGLLRWCRPRVVVSCQGTQRGKGAAKELYQENANAFLSTHEEGAVIIRSTREGLLYDTFRTGKAGRVERE